MVAAGWGIASAWDEFAHEMPTALRCVTESYEIFTHDMIVLMVSAWQKPPAVCSF
jgi:hypothetical protein